MTRRRVTTLVATAFALLMLAGPAQAFGAPVLQIGSSHVLSTVPAGTYARYTLVVSNTSPTDPTSGDVTVDFAVPAGLKATATDDEFNQAFNVPAWNCAIAGDARSVSCDGTESTAGVPIQPGQEACSDYARTCRLFVTVKADENATPGPASPTIQASGGGAAGPANASDPITIGPPPVFSVTAFDGGTFDSGGDTQTQAGSHPDTASTSFTLSNQLASDALELSTDDLKDTIAALPPGVLGNTQAIPTCTEAQVSNTGGIDCPPASQVGVVDVLTNGLFGGGPGNPNHQIVGIYNMKTPQGTPALLAFNILGNVTQVYARVRTGSDYGATVIVKNAPQSFAIAGVDFTVWGVPADPGHDAERGNCLGTVAADTCPSPDYPDDVKPFFTLPTSCVGPGPNNSLQTSLDVTGWQGGEASSSFLSHGDGGPGDYLGITDCNALDYPATGPRAPTLQARPTTNVADAPSGLDVDLHIPQNEDPDGTAEAHLKDTTVTLPEGLVVNPSGANGLDACSSAQFGYTTTDPDGTIHTTPDPATCPDAAKLGTVEVDSPLVDHPLEGAVYIAKPFDNPFDSLLALYITIDDPQTGVVVKLAGEVTPDPDTGQLTATFTNNPQLPFEHFLLHFFGGAGGSLRTPAVCGNYQTTSSLIPWSAPDSGPPATPFDSWSITQGPGGGACANSEAEQPNSPSLDAGTISPLANNYSPVVVNLSRADGSQQFAKVTLTAPPGLTGKLAGIPACSEAQIAQAQARNHPGDGAAEQADPSCPAASQVGTLDVAAGAGPAPYWAKGKVYMSGPYKGAPLSLAVIAPAVAGPFDLGVVVTRIALRIDPTTAQITSESDPIPSILHGIPLDLTQVKLKLDRDQFTRTGTNCDEHAFAGSLLSTLSQSVPLAERFQLAECTGLGFKPQFKLALSGGTKRNGHPAFTTTITYPQGAYANLAKAQVTLPKQMQLDQGHIQAPCTRPQFAAGQCPDASVIGSVTATTPLLDYQVSGPVYLRTGDNPLPDVVLDLHGPASQPLRFVQVGKIDTVNARLRTTFDTVPDAPLSTVVVSLVGGAKGLLVNNSDLCTQKDIATLLTESHNGKTADSNPKVAVAGCPKPHKKKHHKRHKRHKRHHQ
jgi:hypothetical protein